MAYTFNIGSIRCHILSDGIHAVDGGATFGVVPRALWQQIIEPDAKNQVPFDVRCLLIESDTGLILVDTGYGDKMSVKRRQILEFGDRTDRLLTELERVGFGSDDVDTVLMTHLHGDHIGGNTRWDTSDHTLGPVIPTFPNARYLCQRLDLAEASFPNERTLATYQVENWYPLIERNLLDVADGPLRLATGVRTDVAPGHTAAIQVVWIESSGESLAFLGDACNWAVQLDRLAWVPSFDIYPMTSIETKRRLRAEIIARDALMVFQHDPQIVTGRLIEGKRGPFVKPEIREEAWFDPVSRQHLK